MLVDRRRQQIEHYHVRDLPQLLSEGDRLVLNDTRVIPAQLAGRRAQTGGRWTGLFLETTPDGHWKILCKTRGQLKPGEAVALVVADSAGAAEDAAELVEVEYRELQCVTDPEAALAEGAPLLADEIPGNLAWEAEIGDQHAVEAALGAAAHVTRAKIVSTRVAPNPMEPRACLVAYDAATETYRIHSPMQGVTTLRNQIANYTKVPHDKLVIEVRDVGGGFGQRSGAYPEYIALMIAAKSLGARVRFVDIDETTCTLDPALLEAALTPRTRAIIPVHLYGHPVDLDPILEIAAARRIPVIEDAAQAHGATYKGRVTGGMAPLATFSFYPGKNLGAYGDGGALVTNNAEWATAARMFANHGRTKKYDHDLEGINSRLDGLQAAILTVKLRYIEEWTESRRRNAYRYNAAIKKAGVVTPEELPDVRAVYHLYVVRVPAEQRVAPSGG